MHIRQDLPESVPGTGTRVLLDSDSGTEWENLMDLSTRTLDRLKKELSTQVLFRKAKKSMLFL